MYIKVIQLTDPLKEVTVSIRLTGGKNYSVFLNDSLIDWFRTKSEAITLVQSLESFFEDYSDKEPVTIRTV